jgi:hypothetical protein
MRKIAKIYYYAKKFSCINSYTIITFSVKKSLYIGKKKEKKRRTIYQTAYNSYYRDSGDFYFP